MASFNKEQLLQYMGTLDIATLDKLRRYSEFLIIPEEDLLTDATMIQMVDKAHSLADALFPSWTDRSKSDFGEFLVELMALFSEKNFWYINAFANEGLMAKTRSYSNAYAKASSLGYRAVTCKGSEAQFQITFAAGDTTVYGRGDIVLEVEGFRFTNDAEITVPASAAELAQTITLQQGDQLAEDVTFSGYSVLIRKQMVDISSIAVTVDNILYEEVNTFGFSYERSPHYVTLPEEDGSLSIFFGDGVLGIRPDIGRNIHIEYRRCRGVSGNFEIDPDVTEVLTILNGTTREIFSASILSNPIGGADPESLASIKQRASTVFFTQQAVVNQLTAQNLLNSFDFVHKSNVQFIDKTVAYRIIPTSGDDEPSATEIQLLKDNFEPYILVGYTPYHTANSYQDLVARSGGQSIKIQLVTTVGFNTATIEASVRQIMNDITNPRLDAQYGVGFTKTDTDILIRSSVAGVKNVTFYAVVNGVDTLMPDIALTPIQIFNTVDDSKITIVIDEV